MPTGTPSRRPPPRQRMLDAAFDLFYAEGYGVTVDAVAKHADVAKPTVYAHFPSKDALIGAMLQSVDEGWFARLAAEIERRAGDPVAQLLAPFDLQVADLRADYHGCMLLNSAATFCSPDHPAQQTLVAHDKHMGEVFRGLAAAAGVKHPAAFARQLLLVYHGVKARGLVNRSGAAGADARAAVKALLAQQ